MNYAIMESLVSVPERFYVDPYLRKEERWLIALDYASLLAVRLDGREAPTARVALPPVPLTEDPTKQPHQVRDMIEAARVIYPERVGLGELRSWLSSGSGDSANEEVRPGWFGQVLVDRELVLRFLAPIDAEQRVLVHLRGPRDAVRLSGANWCALVMPMVTDDAKHDAAPRWERRAA